MIQKIKRLIETDEFLFEFISELAKRESWRKEVHRPVYHVHKWWAKRLGSVFRGILIGCVTKEGSDLIAEFYQKHSFTDYSVLDPFMGSGTTVGEAHKLGFTALGRDINPVAVEAVRVALGPMNRASLEKAFLDLSEGVGREIRSLYRSKDSSGRDCDVLYFFWVMEAKCPYCKEHTDLFPSWVIARNAYPNRKPEVQVLCPACGDVFPSLHGQQLVECRSCQHQFNIQRGTTIGANACCKSCTQEFKILEVVNGRRPSFRLCAKLVLTEEGKKEYLLATEEDRKAYAACSKRLREELDAKAIVLPALELKDGYNTRQAMRYGFLSWCDFFNDRQLLALGLLQKEIAVITDPAARNALLILFSGVLEFNNMFASYKGEGTGAVRHMFSHHILRPERTPIEANVWGTPKSSGSFSTLFRSRLLRMVEYSQVPTEVNGVKSLKGLTCSERFSGRVESVWPHSGKFEPRGIYLSCGDSADTGLPDSTIDLVVTDPPFFDNVHYSELADFFYSWQQLLNGSKSMTTRSLSEVQDTTSDKFSQKLERVFRECYRVLKDDGLLVFTYHHSRDEGWEALAQALYGAGFCVTNSHPVKSEMSVAAPKSQAKEPIQIDIILVCRKAEQSHTPFTFDEAMKSAKEKIRRMRTSGFILSRNDIKVVFFGQLLSTLKSPTNTTEVVRRFSNDLEVLKLL